MLDLGYQTNFRGLPVIFMHDRNGETFHVEESPVDNESGIEIGLVTGDGLAHLTSWARTGFIACTSVFC